MALVLLNASPEARLLIALPAAGTAVSYLQALLRFCVAFGLRGVFNFGEVGGSRQVAARDARAADRRRALLLIFAGAVIGLGVGVLAALLPS